MGKYNLALPFIGGSDSLLFKPGVSEIMFQLFLSKHTLPLLPLPLRHAGSGRGYTGLVTVLFHVLPASKFCILLHVMQDPTYHTMVLKMSRKGTFLKSKNICGGS